MTHQNWGQSEYPGPVQSRDGCSINALWGVGRFGEGISGRIHTCEHTKKSCDHLYLLRLRLSCSQLSQMPSLTLSDLVEGQPEPRLKAAAADALISSSPNGLGRRHVWPQPTRTCSCCSKAGSHAAQNLFRTALNREVSLRLKHMQVWIEEGRLSRDTAHLIKSAGFSTASRLCRKSESKAACGQPRPNVWARVQHQKNNQRTSKTK